MMIVKSFEFNPFGENTYIVYDSDTLQAAVIDPGMSNQEEINRFTDFIESNNLRVVALLNTHMHIDHILGDDIVKEQYNVKLQASVLDEFLGKGRAAQASMFHLSIDQTTPLSVDIDLRHGDTVTLGNKHLEVLSVPGHSPGSLCFYSPDGGFVITGDVIFQGSIGRTDLPGGDYATLIRAIQNNIMTLPLDTVIYPGHGPSTTVATESVYNPYL